MGEENIWWYWRAYYDINRNLHLGRVKSAWDALKIARQVTKPARDNP